MISYQETLYFQADLKVVNDAKGGSFYRDHLPLLGKLKLICDTDYQKYLFPLNDCLFTM